MREREHIRQVGQASRTGVRRRSAGFQTCCIAGFQTGRPYEFVDASKLKTTSTDRLHASLEASFPTLPANPAGARRPGNRQAGRLPYITSSQFVRAHKLARPAGLETGDTAGLEACATSLEPHSGYP